MITKKNGLLVFVYIVLQVLVLISWPTVKYIFNSIDVKPGFAKLIDQNFHLLRKITWFALHILFFVYLKSSFLIIFASLIALVIVTLFMDGPFVPASSAMIIIMLNRRISLPNSKLT
jgi:hypothetical protein